jgi:ribosome maturation factor RimP
LIKRHFLRHRDFKTNEDVKIYVNLISNIFAAKSFRGLIDTTIKNKIMTFFIENESKITPKLFKYLCISLLTIKFEMNNPIFRKF